MYITMTSYLFGASEYLKYVNEVINEHVDLMKKDHGLHCSGSGGNMPNDVEEIKIMYNLHSKSSDSISIEDARKLEVDAVQKLVRIINKHEKVRPFLREYPFGPERVDVSIGFYKNGNETSTDGSITFVFNVGEKIYYRATETRTRKQSHYIYLDPKKIKNRKDPEEWRQAKIKAQKKADNAPLIKYEEFVPIFDEPFEEAERIVEKTRSKESLNLNAEKFIDLKPKSKLESIRSYFEKVCQKIPFIEV